MHKQTQLLFLHFSFLRCFYGQVPASSWTVFLKTSSDYFMRGMQVSFTLFQEPADVYVDTLMAVSMAVQKIAYLFGCVWTTCFDNNENTTWMVTLVLQFVYSIHNADSCGASHLLGGTVGVCNSCPRKCREEASDIMPGFRLWSSERMCALLTCIAFSGLKLADTLVRQPWKYIFFMI